MKKSNLLIKSIIAVAVITMFTACTKELDKPQNDLNKTVQQMEVIKARPLPYVPPDTTIRTR